MKFCRIMWMISGRTSHKLARLELIQFTTRNEILSIFFLE